MSNSLQSGNSISHYRVISPLGAGGMGEVYMAQDEKLERAVALKILPPELVRNEERLRRFVQEAKSASSLSHPNIVTIYEIGQGEVRAEGETGDLSGRKPGSGAGTPTAEGAIPAQIHFIAMELITGETLKHKIHEEKVDLKTLLRYLAQAAEGLAKAHSAGIVHRDLKPDNIMITKDGYAKVLDFGLAKLTERKEEGTEVTSAPTREQTRDGVVLGTVGYMSPEQVQGKSADHRADVFSFGCLLYEAATGRKPFPADTDVEIMHRILRDTPEAVEGINPKAPADLRRLIRRCLSKNPDRRFQSMKDLAIELSEIVEEYDELSASADSDSTAGSGGSGAIPLPGGRSVGLKAGLAAAAVIALGGIAFGLYGLMRGGRPASPSPQPFQSMKMSRLTSSGRVAAATLSHDGRYLAQSLDEAGRYSLRVLQVATGSDVQILAPQDEPVLGLAFSPDENYVYYIKQETEGPGYSVLFQVPSLGGPVRKLIFDIDSAVTFSPDGKRIAFTRGYPQNGESALMVASADGSGERPLAMLKNPDSFANVSPSWSPDGRRIAAIAGGLEGGIHMKPVLVDAEDGRLTYLGDKRWFPIRGIRWLPDGSGLAISASELTGGAAGQIWVLQYPGGETQRITNDLNRYRSVSITADGKTLATIQSNRIANLWVAAADDVAAARQITSGATREDAVQEISPAPDGSVLFVAQENQAQQIWRLDPDGRRRTRLTRSGILNAEPSLARDGSRVAFTSLREDGLPHIWTMDPDGGLPRQVTDGTGERGPSISPDGGWITYVSIADNSLWRVPAEGGTPKHLVDRIMGMPIISPDGTKVAMQFYDEGGDRLQRAMKVIDAATGSVKATIPFPDGFGTRWHPDGDSLTVLQEVNGMFNVWRMPLDGGEPTQLTALTGSRTFSHAWSPDGKRLYLTRGEITRDVVLITGFR